MAGKTKRRKQRTRSRQRWRTSRMLLWAGLGLLAVLIAALGFLAFVGADDDEPRRRVRQEPVVSEDGAVTVDVIDNDYEPRDLTVRPGTEITWRFEGDLPHTVTDFGEAFDSGVLEEGDNYVLTFRDAGEWDYYCTLHHAMQGVIRVVPAE